MRAVYPKHSHHKHSQSRLEHSVKVTTELTKLKREKVNSITKHKNVRGENINSTCNEPVFIAVKDESCQSEVTNHVMSEMDLKQLLFITFISIVKRGV